MSEPIARIVHRSAGRIRLRIAAMRGDRDFFARLAKEFSPVPELTLAECNPVSGSLLFTGAAATPEAVADAGAAAGLFALDIAPRPPVPLARRVAEPIGGLDRGIRRYSEGVIDLSGAFFILMLFFGIFELARGKFRTPPWYTLFWYAFGVFSKSVADHYAETELPD